MVIGNWLSLLARQSSHGAPIGWDEIVVGHDFGFLKPEEIQSWVRDQGFPGEACEHLASLSGAALESFEMALWLAAAEVTGKAPRPGGRRWAQAQDRWRLALLKDVLEAPLGAETLGIAVETIYECVGCPEDMLGLWRRADRWAKTPAAAERSAIQAFIQHHDRDLSAVG